MTLDINTSRITYKGYIEKKGGNVHNWKRRCFVIVDNTLSYFRDDSLKERLGSMQLIDASTTLEECGDGPGYYYMIHLAPSTGAARSEYLLRSPTAEERDEWIRQIMKANILTIFSRPLSQALKINPKRPNVYLPIPYFFVKAINYVIANSMDMEGIYRLNGSGSQIEAIQNKINSNQDFEFTDAHVATGLIKLYMRTLPEPLMMKNNFSALKLLFMQPEAGRAQAIRPILRSLQIADYILIHFLFNHLIELLKHEENTKMDMRALSVCIGPSLIYGAESSAGTAYDESSLQQNLCFLFFKNFDEIFSKNPLMTYGSNGNGNVYKMKVSLDDDYPYTFKVKEGTIIQSLSEDSDGWMICVHNDIWGVIHRSHVEEITNPHNIITGLSHQTSKWQLSTECLAELSEKCPESIHLYETLFARLKDLREKGQRL